MSRSTNPGANPNTSSAGKMDDLRAKGGGGDKPPDDPNKPPDSTGGGDHTQPSRDPDPNA